MKNLSRGFGRGDSLIEVLVALALSAVTALGIIGSQMWLARNERSLLARELATSIADSVAEGIRTDADRDPVVAQWRTRAAGMVPNGDIDVLARGDGLHIAVVKWRVPGRVTAAKRRVRSRAWATSLPAWRWRSRDENS